MRFLALATDYDGTLATHGALGEATVEALRQLARSGRRLIMVTGRELDDLKQVCPQLELFDLVVAENGALLYKPADKSEKTLGEPPPEKFLEELQRRGVSPFSVGRVIVATWEPHETTVLEIIRDLGLELQVIFNKGAVMILPGGINKATGLAAALTELSLSPRNVVGIGDAENDHAFMSQCECAVAVANALPAVCERADWVTEATHGAGVEALIRELIEHDLQALEPRLQRHWLTVAKHADGSDYRIPPHGRNMLVAGPSGSGKSTFTMGVIEQLAECQYQFCIIDPEGDYVELENTMVMGGFKQPPNLDEVCTLLRNPRQNLVVNLIGLRLEQRPEFFSSLFMRLLDERAKTGRPHWIVIDEAHHLLPVQKNSEIIWPGDLSGMLLITVHPDHVSPGVLQHMEYVVAVGKRPGETFKYFADAVGKKFTAQLEEEPAPNEIYICDCLQEIKPLKLQRIEAKSERRRHVRKYMEGELFENENFFFRGPEGNLNLRAQNLQVFLQMAAGVDDVTWIFHLERHDYSAWFRGCIKDAELADEAEQIENSGQGAAETRAQIAKAVEKRYTAPA